MGTTLSPVSATPLPATVPRPGPAGPRTLESAAHRPVRCCLEVSSTLRALMAMHYVKIGSEGFVIAGVAGEV